MKDDDKIHNKNILAWKHGQNKHTWTKHVLRIEI